MRTMKQIIKGKKITALAIIFAFVFTSLTCCCLTKVHASPSVKLNKPSHCHPSNTQKSVPEKSKPCECAKMTGPIPDQAIQPFALENILKTFEKLMVHLKVFQPVDLVSINRIDTGPPICRSSIPIYLQTSNLRL